MWGRRDLSQASIHLRRNNVGTALNASIACVVCVMCGVWHGVVCVCVCGVRVRGQHRQAAVNTTDLLLLSSLKEQS